MERKSGILMHISSLPSPYGIGTLGKAAYEFADFLKASGQRYWQLLPLGPTGFGDSPYQSFSTFAGNPYFIDLDILREDGLLTRAELESPDWGSDPGRVDYGKIYAAREPILRKAFSRGYPKDKAQVDAFVEEAPWLSAYALFMALKAHFGGKSWLEWPDEDIRLKKPEAVERYRRLLREDIQFHMYLQYLFFQQWNALRDDIHAKGIEIIGDLPIYVALDSADVWWEPEYFQLDQDGVPTEVSGVPPDYFSEDGQLWGNPLYDYARMKANGYGWWIRRVEGAARLFDVIRIDHFRGMESYWAVPYGEATAKNGVWKKGPGMELVSAITKWFPNLSLIAEDLGLLTPEVRQLLQDSGLPGMKVLEFAFEAGTSSDYLPHKYDRNCVCYVGTHDNETLMQWIETAPPENVRYAEKYFGLNRQEGFNWGFIRGGMSSAAGTFIVSLPDCLALGAEGRMNAPGTATGNWSWRLQKGQLTKEISDRLLQYAKLYGRI